MFAPHRKCNWRLFAYLSVRRNRLASACFTFCSGSVRHCCHTMLHLASLGGHNGACRAESRRALLLGVSGGQQLHQHHAPQAGPSAHFSHDYTGLEQRMCHCPELATALNNLVGLVARLTIRLLGKHIHWYIVSLHICRPSLRICYDQNSLPS